MGAPKLPTDPSLQAEQAAADSQLVSSLTAKTQGDSASLMARYGTQLAMAGAQQSPLTSVATGGLSGTMGRMA